jgi:hypothetical protein
VLFLIAIIANYASIPQPLRGEAEILVMHDSKDGGDRATQEAKAEDAYMDVGVRQRLEHVVEQLQVHF